MRLRRVSFAVADSPWLDIAAEGVNKATAAEQVRAASACPVNGFWPSVTVTTTSNSSPGLARGWPQRRGASKPRTHGLGVAEPAELFDESIADGQIWLSSSGASSYAGRPAS
jgi:hypothetical protein